MGGCSSEGRCYMLTAAGIAKIVAIIAGAAPVILSFILYDYYQRNPRPESRPHIRIPKELRAAWEFGFLIVVCAALGITAINLVMYTFFKCFSRSTWGKRFDCGYLALGGAAQATVGFIMVGSALSSMDGEPVDIKYAAGFLGIVTGIVYWGSATLVNRD